MIYLVSKNKTLFGSTRYDEISFNGAINILRSLGKLLQLDTETTGLDEHTKTMIATAMGLGAVASPVLIIGGKIIESN